MKPRKQWHSHSLATYLFTCLVACNWICDGSVAGSVGNGRRLLDAEITLKINNHNHTAAHTSARDADDAQLEPEHLLDIVIAHHNEWNEEQVRPFWESFINLPKCGIQEHEGAGTEFCPTTNRTIGFTLLQIKELRPYVYVYCQNPDIKRKRLTEMFGNVLSSGEVVMLENKGREGRVYLHHIVHHYDHLARHTLFSQDVPGEAWVPIAPALPRMELLFGPNTGVLALSEVWIVVCEEMTWIDNAGVETHLMAEVSSHTSLDKNDNAPLNIARSTYAMIVGRHCPSEGFAGMLKGEFIASARRIRGRDKGLYKEMLQLIEANQSHPLHRRHNTEWYKQEANPYIGHVYERSWSLLLDCYAQSDPSHWIDTCKACEASNYENCALHACQCIDPVESDSKGHGSVKLHVHKTGQKSSSQTPAYGAALQE